MLLVRTQKGAAAGESGAQAPPKIGHRVAVGSGSPVPRYAPRGAGSGLQHVSAHHVHDSAIHAGRKAGATASTHGQRNR